MTRISTSLVCVHAASTCLRICSFLPAPLREFESEGSLPLLGNNATVNPLDDRS